MQKGCLLLTLASIFTLSNSYALNQFDGYTHRIAVQTSLTTGGNLGIGLTNYTPSSELGFSVSGSVNNAHYETKQFIPVLFGGFRHLIGEQTYFAYGIDLASKFGKDEGQTIKSNIFIGPYISLEQALTSHLLLVGWIDPYSFEYEKRSCTSLTTQKFFGSGGIAFSYLF